MREFDIRKTQYSVSDFAGWQRDGTLDLHPRFQRRSVWKPAAKSYFIDTVVRGLPAPLIYLRETVDVAGRTRRAVVDGQQRLRTLFAYIDKDLLPDFDKKRDEFTISATHNPQHAGKSFKELPERLRNRLLAYQLSTHVLPLEVEDRDVLELFARLNSTGLKVNKQELRNAAFFGEFKSTASDLALEHLDEWLKWKVFTDDEVARMKEVELTSDLLMNMINGLSGKSQTKLDSFYSKYDDKFPGRKIYRQRFQHVMEQIDSVLGDSMATSVFADEVLFFTLFVYLYDRMYSLGSPPQSDAPRKLPPGLRQALLITSKKFGMEKVPKKVLDAVRRAPVDIGRRRTRLEYLKKQCDESS